MGFPSPADDYTEARLDIRALVVQHPAATFFLRAASNSMRRAGIAQGDVLVVDRSLEPHDGHIVVARLAGELHVRQLRVREGVATLISPEPRVAPLPLGGEGVEGGEVWGVVTFVIKRLVVSHAAA